MAEQPCIIGHHIEIQGNLTGAEDLIVEGKIEGTIKLSNHLLVEASGIANADIEVEELTVNGTVQGDIFASKSVAISADAKVIGNIRAPRIVIDDGARFRGRIEMDVELPDELLE